VGLFGKKAPLASNAPRHWPPVTTGRLDADNLSNRTAAVLGGLLEGFQSKGIEATPIGVLQYRMFEDGILEVPLEIEEANRRHSIFIYPAATPEAASHFSGVRQFLREKAGATAVYYCPEAIQPAKPSRALEPLDTRMFFNVDDEEPAPFGEYALWWASDDQPSFAAAPARHYVTRAFQAFDGLEPWLFMAFVNDLQLQEKPPEGPVGLPDEALIHPIQGPDRQFMLLCASAEKGISFAFPTATTPIKYRDTFLKLYAEFCEDLAGKLREQGAARLTAPDESPLAWWTFMTSVADKQRGDGGRTEKVGVVMLDEE
jgi:hypothetical protein